MSADGSSAEARASQELAWRGANVWCLQAEMQRLRLTLRREVLWLREQWPKPPSARGGTDEIRDAEVDRLLDARRPLAGLAARKKSAFFREHPGCRQLGEQLGQLEAEIAQVRLQQVERNRPLPLDSMCQLFRLGHFERNVLLLCLGAAVDPALRRVMGYLQDDSALQRVSPQLALELFVQSEEELHAALHAFQPSAPLRYYALLEMGVGEATLARSVALPERVTSYLQGFNRPEPEALAWLRHVAVTPLDAPSRVAELESWARRELANRSAPRLNLVGVPGSGRRALARAVSQRLGLELYELNLNSLAAGRPEPPLAMLGREAVLMQAALYLDVSDVDLLREPASKLLVDRLIEQIPVFVFIAGRRSLPFEAPLPRISLQKPGADAQLAIWRKALGESEAVGSELPSLVEQFSFGPTEIETIVEQARLRASLERANSPEMTIEDLWSACGEQGGTTLDGLAQRLEPRAGWEDIVLPKDVRVQLEEVAGQVSERAFVYQNWGFGAKLSRGRGISALFAGPSGTGKTMAAEVLAKHLRLPMYRIDLSGVINKYVGETEKNLSRVFDAAEQSGAILFFDEADALFGKRSEVKDSHDRYANIEINHLLQRMEEYRGLAILATNMKSHLDQAFLRRLRFVIDFPFPEVEERHAIWVKAFPAEAAREGLDLRALARLELTGSSIKNIALNAAFLAASARKPISMRHVFAASKREYVKMEKLMSELERHYGAYATSTESEVN